MENRSKKCCKVSPSSKSLEPLTVARGIVLYKATRCGKPILNKRPTKSKHQTQYQALWMTRPSRIKTSPLWNIQPTCNTMDVTIPSPQD
jgi:hypothetical protein